MTRFWLLFFFPGLKKKSSFWPLFTSKELLKIVFALMVENNLVVW